ncbi:MAG: IS5 family transposase [Deltaproteobacteria bacterium]|nr:IS5 family transposase [Deltaproteobacteria bacterium]
MITFLPQVYATDLTALEWCQIADRFPAPCPRGRPRKWEPWQILNAILYVNRTGYQWRMLPRGFPPWETVYGCFWRWQQSGLWLDLNSALGKTARQQAGREPQPSAAIIDSQSVKTSEGGEERGVDVHKQTNGRKRLDVLGFVLLVVVHSAALPDGTGGKLLLQRLFTRIKRSVHNRWCRLKLLWADGAYEHIAAYVRKQFGWRLEVVRRPADATGFTVLPHRWVVERTFGWLGRYRRLCRDFEHTTTSSEAMVYLASIRRTLRLVATAKPN